MLINLYYNNMILGPLYSNNLKNEIKSYDVIGDNTQYNYKITYNPKNLNPFEFYKLK